VPITHLTDSLSIPEAVGSSLCEVGAHKRPLAIALLLEGRPGDAPATTEPRRRLQRNSTIRWIKPTRIKVCCGATPLDAIAGRARSHGQQALTIYTRLRVPNVDDVATYLAELW